MKVTYDADTDTLTMVFREAPVAESDEEKPGVILDFDEDGHLLAVELLDASKRMENPRHIEFHEVA